MSKTEFVRMTEFFNMSEEQRKMFIETTGKTILYVIERRDLLYMAKNLRLEPWMVEKNIDNLLYDLRKSLGWKRYIKALFTK